MGKRKQDRTLFNVGMAKKFMQTVLVADALAELQRANLTTSLREIYYRTNNVKPRHTFDNQNESDPSHRRLEVALSGAGARSSTCARRDAGSRRGAGRAHATATGWTARAWQGGYSVPPSSSPSHPDPAMHRGLVLLVEKGSQWNGLSEDKFWRRYKRDPPTGNGQRARGCAGALDAAWHEEHALPDLRSRRHDPWVEYYITRFVKAGIVNLGGVLRERAGWLFRPCLSSRAL